MKRGTTTQRVALIVFSLFICTFATTGWGKTHGAKKKLDRYTISVLTFGPGDHPFLKFGHNAIRVQDRVKGSDLVYNFGTFEFESDTLIQDFLKGRLMYWVSVDPLNVALAPYEQEGRSAVQMELNLTRKQEKQLARDLKTAALPENRYYRYDYYRDNCSTRIRDLIDEVSEGALREVSLSAATLNWREHTLRLTQDDVPVALGLHILLGPETDKPRTIWEEMFLPPILERTLREATIQRRREGRDIELPLVKKENVLLHPRGHRASPPIVPPTWWPTGLFLGSLIGLMTFGFSWGARRASTQRTRAIFLACLWSAVFFVGLIAGFLSLVFLLLWTTDHQIAHANHNLFAMPPWSLTLPVLAMAAPFWPRASRFAFGTSCLCLLACVVGFVVRLFPESQDTTLFLAFMFPVWLGLVGAFGRVGFERTKI